MDRIIESKVIGLVISLCIKLFINFTNLQFKTIQSQCAGLSTSHFKPKYQIKLMASFHCDCHHNYNTYTNNTNITISITLTV